MLLQKKVIRTIAKASYSDHAHPVFIQYKYLKVLDIVKFVHPRVCACMYVRTPNCVILNIFIISNTFRLRRGGIFM